MIKKIFNKIHYLYLKYFLGKLIGEYFLSLINIFTPRHSLASIKDIKKITVLNIDSLGDSVWISPILRELKSYNPNLHLTLICNRACRDLFEENPYIDKLISIIPGPYYEKISFKGPLLDNQDLLIIPEMGVRPADNARLWGKLHGVPNVFSSNLGHLKKLAHYTLSPNESTWWPKYFLQLLTPLTQDDYKTEPTLEIHTSLKVQENVQAWFDNNLTHGKNLIFIHPNVANYAQETKQWPRENYVKLIETLALNKNNFFLISGSPDERVLCQELIDSINPETQKSVLNIAGHFKIIELFELIKKVNLVLCGDTSILHLSLAAQQHIVCFFGATDYRKIAPHEYKNIKIFNSKTACWPCHKNSDFSPYWPQCIFDRPKCLTDIQPQAVYEYINKRYDF
jgi:ADP-heptose:LPS heptosyltransferase